MGRPICPPCNTMPSLCKRHSEIFCWLQSAGFWHLERPTAGEGEGEGGGLGKWRPGGRSSVLAGRTSGLPSQLWHWSAGWANTNPSPFLGLSFLLPHFLGRLGCKDFIGAVITFWNDRVLSLLQRRRKCPFSLSHCPKAIEGLRTMRQPEAGVEWGSFPWGALELCPSYYCFFVWHMKESREASVLTEDPTCASWAEGLEKIQVAADLSVFLIFRLHHVLLPPGLCTSQALWLD